MLNSISFKIPFVTIIYLLLLIVVSPVIDHSFTSLDEDINMKENNLQILGEVILHLIIIAFIWYIINYYVPKYIGSLLNIKIKQATKSAIGVVSSIVLIGLQKNLIDKLEYITLTHPFRLTDLYG
tara:strand:- start:248 stop:622 length:375 start_codon:yes stop_codon:yes gene_type:complete